MKTFALAAALTVSAVGVAESQEQEQPAFEVKSQAPGHNLRQLCSALGEAIERVPSAMEEISTALIGDTSISDDERWNMVNTFIQAASKMELVKMLAAGSKVYACGLVDEIFPEDKQ